MKFPLLLSMVIVWGLTSCVNNKKDAPKPLSECETVTYSANVNPIIQQNCAIAGCHIAGFPDGDFTNYTELKIRVDDGRFKNSVIDGNTPVMPTTGKLTDAQIRVLQCWMENGAPNN